MVRSHNEDSIAADAANGLVVLADGMGGYNAGEVASGMATTVITTELQQLLAKVRPYEIDPETDSRSPTRLVREQVRRRTPRSSRRRRASRSTRAWAPRWWCACSTTTSMLVAHIGDSRLYRLRGDEFEQITRDHSLLQEQIDCGMITAEQAKHAQHKNLVTRALGIDPTVEPEIHEYDDPARRHLPAVLGRAVRHGEDEDIGMTLQALGGEPQARRAAAGADGQRQRGARQRFGDTRARPAGVPRAARRDGQGFAWLK